MAMSFIRFTIRLLNLLHFHTKRRLFSCWLLLSKRCSVVFLSIFISWIFLILGKTVQYLFDFQIDLINIFYSWIKLPLSLVFIVFHRLSTNRILDGVVIENRFFHFPDLAEDGLFRLPMICPIADITHIFLITIPPDISLIPTPFLHKILIVKIIPIEMVLINTIDCEGLLEMIISKARRRPVGWIFSLLFSHPVVELLFLAFLQTLDPLLTRWGIVLLLDLIYPEGCLWTLEVGDGGVVAPAGSKGLFIGDVWKTIVLHILKINELIYLFHWIWGNYQFCLRFFLMFIYAYSNFFINYFVYSKPCRFRYGFYPRTLLCYLF